MHCISNIFLVLFLTTQVFAIHVNQVGYYPFAKKTATIVDSTDAEFRIVDDETDKIVYRGKCIPQGFDDDAGEYVSVATFAGFNTEGTYRITVGADTSFPFQIQSSCNRNALRTILKSYYFQRAGVALPPAYAGQWERDAGHSGDSALPLLESGSEALYDVRGGWYDAGDFGKYVVNAGITCGTLLGLYELCPDIIGDSSLNIPESGNRQSDLLDEVRYELDWLIRMQDSDGGVFFKVGPIKWYGSILPVDDPSKRYIIGKSTTSTLDCAAVLAMAGRIYKEYDSVFARECTERAELAWKWALENSDVGHPENTGGTGPYEDGADVTYKDEFLWALTELAITTKKVGYLDTLEQLIVRQRISSPAWWQNVKNLSFYSLAVHAVLPDSANLHVATKIIAFADRIINNISQSPYMTPLTASEYSWGSSGICGNFGVALVYAHFITGEQKYLDALVLSTDYLFGRNPVAMSYVTGLGTHYPRNPHHRQSTADDVKEPVPGFLVGGANNGSNGDDVPLTKVVNSGAPPAKCYIDDYDSWASNENAINQNAPWVLVLGYLEDNESENHTATIKSLEEKRLSIRNTARIRRNSKGTMLLTGIAGDVSRLEVFDLRGRCLYTKCIPSDKRSVLLNTTNSGILVLKLHGKNRTIYLKTNLFN